MSRARSDNDRFGGIIDHLGLACGAADTPGLALPADMIGYPVTFTLKEE